MTEKRWLHFAHYATAVLSAGAVTNQLVAVDPSSTISIGTTGIRFPDGSIQSSAATSGSVRRLYLSQTSVTGELPDEAVACAPGFHFASIWKLLDPSSLYYDKSPGLFTADACGGPSVNWWGWIRTGGGTGSTDEIGTENCRVTQAWDSASTQHTGTISQLPQAVIVDWSHPPTLISPWTSTAAACNQGLSVWCVEDDAGTGS